MSVEANIHGALMARVNSLALTPTLEIVWPASQVLPPETEYLRVTHLPAAPIRRALSAASPMDRTGILQLDLFSPAGKFERDYIDRAGQIAAHFPPDQMMSQGGVFLMVVKTDVLPSRADGNHWHVPIRVNYRGFA